MELETEQRQLSNDAMYESTGSSVRSKRVYTNIILSPNTSLASRSKRRLFSALELENLWKNSTHFHKIEPKLKRHRTQTPHNT